MPSDRDSTGIKPRRYPAPFPGSALASPRCCADGPEGDLSALADEIAMPSSPHVNAAL